MSNHTPDQATSVRVCIIGAGFGGVGTAIRLKQAGIDDFVILEKAADVGGCWRDNHYPDAACDVPSHVYSFSFAPKPDWKRSFATQGEIQGYLRDCAYRFGIVPHLRFDHQVDKFQWHDDEQRWHIDTNQGTIVAQVVVSATGPLSLPQLPDIPGIDTFRGKLFHSARWDHDHDLTGKRVAVIGTGASAIQFVPAIQPRVDHLVVFQRTPPWVTPRADRQITDLERTLFTKVPASQRLVRNLDYAWRELYVLGLVANPELVKVAEKVALAHLKRQVRDPGLRDRLTPRYALGCKRVLISNTWYPAVSQPNVTVESDGIAEIRPNAVVTRDGTVHEVDTIICGTGFHVADQPVAQLIHDDTGCSLADRWADKGVGAYLGTNVAGLPNLFLIVGPNTALGHNSLVYMMEQQIGYVLRALQHMDRTGASSLDVRRDVQDRYNDDLQSRLARTVWNRGGCSSYYLDDLGRNFTMWPGFTFQFRAACRHFNSANYHQHRHPTRNVPSPPAPDDRTWAPHLHDAQR